MTRNGRATYALVPGIERYLCKFGWTISGPIGRPEQHDAYAYMRLKGCVLSVPSLRVIPVLRVLYDFYSRIELDAIEPEHYDGKMQHCVVVGDSRTERFYADLYGIGINNLREVEAHLSNHLRRTGGGMSVWGHPALDTMVARRRSAEAVGVG